MTSVAAPSPLLAPADPSFARTGATGDSFAPVLASLLAPAEAVPVPPAIGTSVPLPGKLLPDAEVLPDLFEDIAPLALPSGSVGARSPLPHVDVTTTIVAETAPPLAGSGDTPVARAPAPPPPAAPDTDQGGTMPAAAATIPVPSFPERQGAPPPSPSKGAAVPTTGFVSDRPAEAESPPATLVLQTAPLAPVPPAVPDVTIKAPPLKTDHAPRPVRFAPPARQAAPGITEAPPPAVAATDATEKGSAGDTPVADVEPAPLPSGEQGVVAAAVPSPVPLPPTPDPVRADAVMAAPRRPGRVAATPLPVSTRAAPVVREARDVAGDKSVAATQPAPAAPLSEGTPPVALTATGAVDRPAPPRETGKPVVGATAAVAPERPVLPVTAVATSPAPAVEGAVGEPVPVAVPAAVVRVVGDAVPPPSGELPTPGVRPTAAPPAEPSPTIAIEPRPDTAPLAPARAVPVEQPRIERAAPVILPALQAFGVQLHRAAAAERRSLPAVDASALVAPASAPVVVPTAPAPVDVTRPDWPQAMVARIEQLRERHDEVDTRIRLHPDALGAVEVTLRREGNGTHVRLDAAEPATRALLADAQPRLQALAETRGLRLSGSEVAGGTAQGSTGGWTGNDRRPPASAPLTPPRRLAADTADDPTDTRLA